MHLIAQFVKLEANVKMVQKLSVMLDFIPPRAVQIVINAKMGNFLKILILSRVKYAHLDTNVRQQQKLFAMPDITLKLRVLIASYVSTGPTLKCKVKLQIVMMK